MNKMQDNINEKPIIIIDEKPEDITNQQEGEEPVMIIENDNNNVVDSPMLNIAPTSRKKGLSIAVAALISLITLIVLALGYKYYRTYINIGVPVSVK